MAKRDFDGTPKAAEAEAAPAAVACGDQKLVLFATKTCPNCKMAEKFLNDAGMTFEKVYAEDAPDFATKLDVKKAPTLVIMEGDVAVAKIVNVSEIRKFIDQQ